MSSNNHANKARNQTRGSGEINAMWFQIRVSRNRRRRKIARKSRQINRRK